MKKIIFNNYNDWLNFRNEKIRIGASEIPTLLGLNEYETIEELYYKKKNNIKTEENEYMKRGKVYEPVIINLFENATKHKIINKDIEEYIVYTLDDDRYMATPDKEIVLNSDADEFSSGTNALLECKYTTSKINKLYIPPRWLAQVQWQLLISGYDIAFLAWLSQDKDFDYVVIKKNEELIYLAFKQAEYFFNCIDNDIIPENTDLDLSELNISKIEVDNTLYDVLKQYNNTTKQINELEKTKKLLSDIIKENLSDYTDIYYNNKLIATYKTTKDTYVFDDKEFKKDNLELYNKYLKIKKGYKRLIFKEC